MRRGFTIIELLVASLLLGMLMTILTQIFNQSSIAWRTGTAGVADLDEVRDNIAEVREEADNVYVWHGETYRLLGLWQKNGSLRDRAIDAEDSSTYEDGERAKYLASKASLGSANLKPRDFKILSVGSGDSGNSLKNYTVNVKSAGPDRTFDTYDDIWSFPDDF